MSSIASLTDSVCAVKRLVFDLNKITLDGLFEILKNNWEGHEKLRLEAKRLPEKYGNSNPLADSIARELSDFTAECINNKPNGRGGVFKAGLFGIDHYVIYGQNTMATPDGRKVGEPLFACVFGAILLGENIFRLQYLLAFVLISAGILIGNKEKKK